MTQCNSPPGVLNSGQNDDCPAQSNSTKGNQLGSSLEVHAIRIPSANSTTASIPYTFKHALKSAFQTRKNVCLNYALFLPFKSIRNLYHIWIIRSPILFNSHSLSSSSIGPRSKYSARAIYPSFAFEIRLWCSHFQIKCGSSYQCSLWPYIWELRFLSNSAMSS